MSISPPLDEHDLYVEDSGSPNSPTIVCLHSLFFDHRMFDAFAASARQRFRVVSLDFRNQGSSLASGDHIISIQEAAVDVIRILDNRGLTAVHLVGCSMGGDVALEIAAFRPDLVRSLSLLGTSARAESPAALHGYVEFVDTVRTQGVSGELLDFVTSSMFGATTRADPAAAETVAEWRHRIAGLDSSIGRSLAGVVYRADSVGLLPVITAPALVISGDECTVRPPEWARELAEGLPRGRLMMLDGVGHSPLLEAPDITRDAILSFLAEWE